MNISYKLLLSTILLTALNSSVFASSEDTATSTKTLNGSNITTTTTPNASNTPANGAPERTTSTDVVPTVFSRINKSVVNASAKVSGAAVAVATNRKVQIGTGATVLAAGLAYAAYKYYAEETVASLQAKIDKLNAEIEALQDAHNIEKSAEKIIARNALEDQLAELKAKQDADVATEEIE